MLTVMFALMLMLWALAYVSVPALAVAVSTSWDRRNH